MAIAAIAAATLCVASPAAAALTINSSGNLVITSGGLPSSVTYDFNGTLFGTPLAGSLVLTENSVVGNNYTFGYTFSTASNANLVGFGFDAAANAAAITAASEPSSDAMKIARNVIFPGSQTVDVCVYSGNNCSAANGQGKSFNGTFTLTFASGAPIVLDNFVGRYASIGISGQSGELAGVPRTPPVPEPATWAMMLLGMGAISVAMRRRRKPSIAQIA
ncbi:MAG TPA: cistern family PEP-CTERM protein [Sphingomicrobium sp.]|nr:cistern family PEP-CTERM protein [Sphingomicrobium sp.]